MESTKIKEIEEELERLDIKRQNISVEYNDVFNKIREMTLELYKEKYGITIGVLVKDLFSGEIGKVVLVDARKENNLPTVSVVFKKENSDLFDDRIECLYDHWEIYNGGNV